jgi:phosphatidylglycerophosphatase A
MNRLFITFFYTGLSPFAPGSAGSIAAAVVGYFILGYFPLDTLFLLTILITIIGIREINKYEKITGTHDDKSIVIDEVAGLWLAFVFSSATLPQMIFSFAYFRLFDIWKPSIIGRIDRDVKGGLGVMGDDIIAGIAAGICSAGTWKLISMYL